MIPSANGRNLVVAVHALLDAHPGLSASRVVVVDDGARALARPRLPPDVVWLEGPRPFVFARSVNLGFGACADDDTIVMGDDVVVRTRGAFDRLAAVARDDPGVGIVSPGIVGAAGLSLVVSNEVRVRHDGTLPSVYRTRPDFRAMNDQNQALLAEKRGPRS